MGDDATLTFEYQKHGAAGKVRITARFPDGQTFTDKLDALAAADRERFARAVCKGCKGIDRKVVAAELERIAGEVAARPSDRPAGGDDDARLSQADRLVALADGVELFHAPGGTDADAFARVPVGGHHETWAVNSGGFRRWLAKRFYDAHGKAPGAQAIQDALTVLAGRAVHDGPERPVAVRVAECDSSVWLDLADADWRAVRIGPDGWEVVTDPPVRFVRKRGMQPLPEPARGGRVDDLRPFVNLPNDDQWVLFVAWLVAALRPGRAFALLAVNGEQGSAKSSLCRTARALIDPNDAPLRRVPKEERDIAIAAANGWVVGYDNLSGISATLSDALCCLSTGSAFATRKLYTDDEEALFAAKRPVLVNGIEDLATRPDLLDRAVRLTLPAISDDARRSEDAIDAGFAEVRPRVLGALLDAVSAGLRNLPAVQLDRLPRMADFARFVAAAEPALGWPAGRFLAVYTANREEANAAALDHPVAAAVQAFMRARERWVGPAGQLLTELNQIVDDISRKSDDWPKKARGLRGVLQRMAPNLRRDGVECRFPAREAGGSRTRNLILERVGVSPFRPSPANHNEYDGDGRDGGDRSDSSCAAREVYEWSG